MQLDGRPPGAPSSSSGSRSERLDLLQIPPSARRSFSLTTASRHLELLARVNLVSNSSASQLNHAACSPDACYNRAAESCL